MGNALVQVFLVVIVIGVGAFLLGRIMAAVRGRRSARRIEAQGARAERQR